MIKLKKLEINTQMSNLDLSKLEAAKLKVFNGLKKKFPEIVVEVEDYYCGMGYCGIKIIIVNETYQDEVSKYYTENLKIFAKHTVITKIENDKLTKNTYLPGEVKIIIPSNC